MAGAVLVCAACLPGAALGAQQLDPPPEPADSGTTVRVVPGARYEAGALRRLLVGDNRRDLWVRELEVPLLDLDRFAGGLVPEDQGGNQSRTLHMVGADGRTYIFRSVDKYLGQVLQEDLQGTLVEDLGQDHTSAFHPGASFVVPRLHEALGQLAILPVYRVMPDDPRLGEYRETFAGMLGTVVERPNEGELGEALFAGSHRIVGTEELFDKLEDHPRNRVAAREFLAARLVDFLVGDTDRGPDQWRWARESEPRGFRWRPIARDRDWALMDAEGLLPWIVGRFYPKLTSFEEEYPDVKVLTWADVGMGRRLLAGLDAATWDSVTAVVVSTLTDDVIDEAVGRLPPEMKPDHADALAATLKARRDRLPGAVRAWYRRLSGDVDVHGTDLPDRAEVVRREDGSVEVTLLAPADVMRPVVEGDPDDQEEAAEHLHDPYYDPYFEAGEPGEAGWLPTYHRVFQPGETEEIRVYLHGDDDVGVVRGRGPGEIRVRLIGGGGTDALHDEGEPSGATGLYDEDEDTRFAPGPATVVDMRSFETSEPSERFLIHKTGYDRHRDWGETWSWLDPVVDYQEGAGLVLGGGPTWTDYQFRANPHGAQIRVRGLVSTRTGGLGLDAVAEGRPPSSPSFLRVHVRASQFEAVRFYGYGNTTRRLRSADALVLQDRLLVEASVGTERGPWHIEGGPRVRFTEPDVPPANPATEEVRGSGPMMELGASLRGSVDLRRPGDGRGVSADGSVFASPYSDDDEGAWSTAEAELRGYLPLVLGTTLAARLGGSHSWGDFPIHGAANLGGSSTLRGYRWQRFAGEAAAYGGVELRVPLFRANLLLAKGSLGVMGLADAGRVWYDGESEGDWHTGHGAGVFFRTLDSGVYVVWARGEQDRVYVGTGFPF